MAVGILELPVVVGGALELDAAGVVGLLRHAVRMRTPQSATDGSDSLRMA